MKLTSEQIDLIDRFLEQHQLDFLDFKLEVKDHLATAIEELMKDKEISFEQAFPLVAKAWETELRVQKYWLISNERLFPNFVIQRIKNKVAFHYVSVFILAFLGTLLVNNFPFENQVIKYGVGFCGMVSFLLRRIMNNRTVKTSYRFQFNYFYMTEVLVFAYFFVFQSPFSYANFIGFLVLVNFPFSIYYFLKHQQFVNKYQLK